MSAGGGCAHRLGGPGAPVATGGLAEADFAALQVARHFFRSFAAPQSHGWLDAFPVAERSFAGQAPAAIAVAVLGAVQAMGRVRQSGFSFSSPTCPDCAQLMTDHERHFISVLMALRRGERSRAVVHAMLLCEGNDSGPFLAAMDELGELIDGQG